MGQSVIIDNWSLQIVTTLLTEGLETDESEILTVSPEGVPAMANLSSAVIAVDCLFDLLTNVVLRDQLLVDDRYVDAWNHLPTLSPFVERGLIRAYPFNPQGPEWTAAMEAFLARLTFSEPLKALQAENVAVFKRLGAQSRRIESQIVWGGAGMLARAFRFETPYSPHIARRLFFQRAGMFLPDTSAADRTIDLLRTAHTRLHQRVSPAETLMSLRVVLDPIPLQVIREAQSPSDLIPAALTLRERYQPLRDWLGCYQQAVVDNEGQSERAYSKVLRDIAQAVDEVVSPQPGQTSLSIGLDGYSLSLSPVSLLGKVRRRVGVRGLLNRLVMQSDGRRELQKFLGWYGQKGSTTELALVEHFARTP